MKFYEHGACMWKKRPAWSAAARWSPESGNNTSMVLLFPLFVGCVTLNDCMPFALCHMIFNLSLCGVRVRFFACFSELAKHTNRFLMFCQFINNAHLMHEAMAAVRKCRSADEC